MARIAMLAYNSEQFMISRYNYKDLLWLDLESPTHEEVRTIMDEFDIHPIVADELLSPSLRPKVDHYENLIFLILHFPAIRHTHSTSNVQEVDFVIGKNFLITVHYETVDPLHKFSKVFEVNSILDKSNIGDHAGFLFFYMIKKIYSSLYHEIAAISDTLRDIENRIFEDAERGMLLELSTVNRDFLAMRRALRLHDRILESLAIVCTEFFGRDFKHYVENIIGEFHKVNEFLLDQKDILDDLRDTNNALLTTKTNEVIKTLTIISFTAAPASVITWIFSMGVEKPIVDEPYAFWIILSLMAATSMLAYLFAKHKKWI